MRKGILLAALCLTAMPALANENPRSDLNGDGRADLVWRHVERGTNVAWLDGNHATPVGLSAEPGVHWYIAAIGDFDGDGRSDLAWRTDGTSEQATREMHIWPGGVAHDAYAYEVPLFLGIVAVGDFNGDGLDDLFQRHVVDGGVASYLTLCVADRPACYDESSTVSDDWEVAGAGALWYLARRRAKQAENGSADGNSTRVEARKGNGTRRTTARKRARKTAE